MAKALGKSSSRVAQADPSDVIRNLILNCTNPAKFLELHYWSLEPGILPLLRSIAGMLPQTRLKLEAFMMMADTPSAIEASIGNSQITLRIRADAVHAARTKRSRKDA